MATNSATDLYMATFGRMVYKKYVREKEPLNMVLIPLTVAGPQLFTEEEREDVYQRCLNEGKPWQEIPDVAERVKSWHREYVRGIKKGEIY